MGKALGMKSTPDPRSAIDLRAAVRQFHIKMNMIVRREGDIPMPVCDGPDCVICDALQIELDRHMRYVAQRVR